MLHMRHQTFAPTFANFGTRLRLAERAPPTRASSWREAYATLKPPSHGARTLKTSPTSAGSGGRASKTPWQSLRVRAGAAACWSWSRLCTGQEGGTSREQLSRLNGGASPACFQGGA